MQKKNFKSGHEFEEFLFGLPNPKILKEVGSFGPNSFDEDVGELIRDILKNYPQEGFPKTKFSERLFLSVKKILQINGINVQDLKILSLIGTVADIYYETDSVFYLPPSSGLECVVTLDAWLVELDSLREYWIESSEKSVYEEADFQKDLFAHNRILAERSSVQKKLRKLEPKKNNSKDWHIPWVLSREYKRLWERAYLPSIPVGVVDRPMMKPENHLLVTPYHIANTGREEILAKQIADVFLKQFS